MSDNIFDLCHEIYQEHHAAVEMLCGHRRKYSAILRPILMNAVSRSEFFELSVAQDNAYVRFGRKEWCRAPGMKDGLGWRKKGTKDESALVLFEFLVREWERSMMTVTSEKEFSLTVQVTVSGCGDNDRDRQFRCCVIERFRRLEAIGRDPDRGSCAEYAKWCGWRLEARKVRPPAGPGDAEVVDLVVKWLEDINKKYSPDLRDCHDVYESKSDGGSAGPVR